MDLTCLGESPTIYKLLIRKFLPIKALYSFIQKQKKEAIFPYISTWNNRDSNFNILFKPKEKIHESYFHLVTDTVESVSCSQVHVVMENVIKGVIVFHIVVLISTNLRYRAYFIVGTH